MNKLLQASGALRNTLNRASTRTLTLPTTGGRGQPLEGVVFNWRLNALDRPETAESKPRLEKPPRQRTYTPGGGRQGRDAVRFEHISSTANDTVKLVRSLERKKDREETGLFLAEGARHAEEALANGWSPVYAFASETALRREHIPALLERLQMAGARVLTGSEKVLSTLSRKDNPQAVICAFRQRMSSLSELPREGLRRFVALYEVRDPGNLGTVIRTADAAGCDGVILIGRTCDPFSPEAVRATMGSLFAMRLTTLTFEAFRQWASSNAIRIVAASMHGDHAHDQASFGERCCILMGNEQSGLPAEVEKACDELVRIPMMGRADSLNLASAASVMIYEAWRVQGYRGAVQ